MESDMTLMTVCDKCGLPCDDPDGAHAMALDGAAPIHLCKHCWGLFKDWLSHRIDRKAVPAKKAAPRKRTTRGSK